MLPLGIGWSAQRGSAGYVPQINNGDRALAAHRYASAASAYRYALEWNPDGVEAHNGLGSIYLKTGKKERAVEEFLIVLRLSPHSSEAERGIHEARTPGQEEAAFEALAAQVAAEPNNPEVRTTYAEELVERDKLDDAKSHATVALKLDPRSWHAYCALGRIAFKEGDNKTARSDLLVAVSHDGTDDDAVETLGELAMAEKQYHEAARWFHLLVKILPEEREGYQKLVEALEAGGESQEASKARADLQKLETFLAGSKN